MSEELNFEREEANTNTENLKCEGCGSNLVFNPETQMLVCENCGRQESFEKDLNVKELDIEKGFADSEKWQDETNIFNCENCGAKVVMEKGEIARKCPYCESSHVVQTEDLTGIKPNVVIPFTITKNDSLVNYRKWSKSRLLAPSDFKKNITPEKITGIYTPSFTFDSWTYSTYVGRVGNRRTRRVGTGKNARTETYIVWRTISGRIEHFFDDVFVNCSDKIETRNFDKIMPFNREKACVYEKKFLSGFMASHYVKDIKDCWNDAKKIMNARIKDLIRSKHSYDVEDYINVSTSHEKVTYKYVLLPIYVGNYKYKGKLYTVYINGSTGKVIGKSPISPIRATILGIIIVIALVGLYFLVNYLNA